MHNGSQQPLTSAKVARSLAKSSATTQKLWFPAAGTHNMLHQDMFHISTHVAAAVG
jgi:hypothetical protein